MQAPIPPECSTCADGSDACLCKHANSCRMRCMHARTQRSPRNPCQEEESGHSVNGGGKVHGFSMRLSPTPSLPLSLSVCVYVALSPPPKTPDPFTAAATQHSRPLLLQACEMLRTRRHQRTNKGNAPGQTMGALANRAVGVVRDQFAGNPTRAAHHADAHA
eukprot:2899133-Alexandrium_andersonii.AAC.1